MRNKGMKQEYDFSKGERGKFYHSDAKLNIPVYLEPDVAEFLRKLADEKKIAIESIVNDWLRRDIGLIESVK
jgi:hypothetical protein